MLDITPVTLRRWCEYHSAHLSAGANPPTGKARRFTGRDLEVFKHVRSLRALGLTVADINEQLQSLTFAVVDNDEQPAADSSELAPLASPDAPHSTQALVMVVDSLQRRFDALEAANRRRLDTITSIGIGICIGLLFAVGMIVLAWLYGG